MNKYEVFNETNNEIFELKDINELIEYILLKEKVKNSVFNIIIVDNKYIKNINHKYRNIDAVTDVISFALEDNLEVKFENCRVLGDIYISIEKAQEQSVEYGHSLKRELSFLVIHGLLHLLGYDHLKKEDEKVMFEKQEMILNDFNIKR